MTQVLQSRSQVTAWTKTGASGPPEGGVHPPTQVGAELLELGSGQGAPAGAACSSALGSLYSSQGLAPAEQPVSTPRSRQMQHPRSCLKIPEAMGWGHG